MSRHFTSAASVLAPLRSRPAAAPVLRACLRGTPAPFTMKAVMA